MCDMRGGMDIIWCGMQCIMDMMWCDMEGGMVCMVCLQCGEPWQIFMAKSWCGIGVGYGWVGYVVIQCRTLWCGNMI